MIDKSQLSKWTHKDLQELVVKQDGNIDYYLDRIKALERRIKTYKGAFYQAVEEVVGLKNMIKSWYELLQSDKDDKYAILKSVITVYVENKGGNNE